MSQDEDKVRSRRKTLFVVGTMLWGAVFVALYFTWTAREQRNAPPAEAQGLAQILTDQDLISGTDSESTGTSAEEAEVELTWPESGVTDFELTDQSSQSVSKNDLLGKPWLASFIFTQCAGPCPRVTAAVQELYSKYQETPLRFVTFTVDPARDTPQALAQYADFYQADPAKWFFLTGERDALYGLINGSFLMPVLEAEDPEPGFEIIHTTNICLVNPAGQVVGKYNSLLATDMVRLRRELDRMLKTLPLQAETAGAATTDQEDL